LLNQILAYNLQMERFTDFFGNSVYIADRNRSEKFRQFNFFQRATYKVLNTSAFSTSPVIGHQQYYDWLRENPPGNYALLDAHGNSNENEWYYVDNRRRRPVQSWINSVEGLHSVLFIMVCNPAGKSITADKSAVIHSVGLTNIDDMYKSLNGRLFIPRKGYHYSSKTNFSTRALHAMFSLMYEGFRNKFIDID
jgi:hypothetical protein